MCLEQGLLESLYNFYSSSLFSKNRERDAVMLYRMKDVDNFNAHVAVIPYRFVNLMSCFFIIYLQILNHYWLHLHYHTLY
jgi:hypothetical protein